MAYRKTAKDIPDEILLVAGLVAHDRFTLHGKSKAAKHG